MQTPSLLSQITASPPAQPRAAAHTSNGAPASQFSQALSREVAQRQAPASIAQAAAKPAARQPSGPADKAPVAKASGDKPAQAADQAKASVSEAEHEAEHDAAAAAQAAANTPVVDMLALVASFNQPVQATPSGAVDTEAAAALASGMAGRASAATLAQADAPISLAPTAADDGAAAQSAPPTDFAAQLAAQVQGGPATQNASAFDRAAASKQDNAASLDIVDGGKANAELLAAAEGQGADPKLAGAQPQRADAAPALQMAHDKPAATPDKLEQFTLKEVQSAPAAVAAPVQQTVMSQAVAAAAGDKLSARVGTPAWDNQVSQKIVWMVAGSEQSATLTLNPPDLGPMQVVLNVTNEHADVTFTSAQPEVRQALEDAMPRLREMMSESGISLGQASVNAGTPEQRQAQGDSTGDGTGHGNRSGGHGQAAGGGDNGSASAASARVAPRPLRANGLSGVDTFA